ncbi:hypothetical protein ACH47X_15015 [Promicromonospora kroppenstedtii]|uniref:Uncharacterized protein n=1 Tax=Promicromonospora kroppenstedtii TaxID=440482 RepID=A0ABW7XM95_9MICO
MVDVEIPRVALALEQDRNALATAARKGDAVRIRRGAYCAPDDLRVDGVARSAREDRNRALARVRALDS